MGPVRSVAWRLATSRWRWVLTGRQALAHLGPPQDVGPPGTEAVELKQVLTRLSLEHRQVLVMHHGLGLSVEQCAAELGVAIGEVKSRSSPARDATRKDHDA